MTKFSMCMQSFKSIDNQLAKLRGEGGGQYNPPLPRGKGWKITILESGLNKYTRIINVITVVSALLSTIIYQDVVSVL